MSKPQMTPEITPKPEINSHLYDLSVIKSELDEILIEYLKESENFKESTLLVNIKLLIGICVTSLTIIIFLLTNKNIFNIQHPLIIALIILFWVITYSETLIIKFCYFYTFSGYKNNAKLNVLTTISNTHPVYTVLLYTGDKKIPIKVSTDIRTLYKENLLNVRKFTDIIKDCLINNK
ncbi:hypothetical protein NEIG_02356 [Nematocida sp. ERTm5]|nr:hypothetical protein NEIG_02356 [Nematocida sp. ERTm5]